MTDRRIAWQVVEKPSVWSVITTLGIATTLRTPFEKSVRATGLPAHLPAKDRAFVVPLQVDGNANPALLMDIVAAGAALRAVRRHGRGDGAAPGRSVGAVRSGAALGPTSVRR